MTHSAPTRCLAALARRSCALLGLAPAAACRLPESTPAPRLAFIEKGGSQYYYDAQDRLLRVLVDADNDRRADSQVLYRPDGTVELAELDTDRDDVVNRWERYGVDGTLESVAVSRRSHGRPDAWVHADRSGRVVRRELDEDADGRLDRVEHFEAASGEVRIEELDTDGDGRLDRRLHRGGGGRLEVIEIDRDGDGVWEARRLVRRP